MDATFLNICNMYTNQSKFCISYRYVCILVFIADEYTFKATCLLAHR